ncbi:VgrG-related protein [filamentous cyanobacterium LEGE 11480]|uniref:VgrG-related protein n=1 Tax=Romeriopsis navalis LEGE 11480 TaxID=2777977 RepID=A0A928Z5H7_9CYAN|nr:VgrG-related protein [Romeriopsis navalis]MBE9031488.1 VgrG-related protein [Romeriopsis navalis LEGE 11480]
MPDTVSRQATFTYISKPTLKVDGQAVDEAVMEDVLQITVDESLHLPGMFTIVISNSQSPGRVNQEMWAHCDLFQMGKRVEIGFISSATESHEFQEQHEGSVIQGEITGVETQFTAGAQAPIIVRGYDVSHRLHRGRHNRSFQHMTDADIVTKIAQENRIARGTIEATGAPHEYVFQENQTNMEFLRARAARNGFELFVRDGKLFFRKPKPDEVLELTWLKELMSFQVRVTSGEQVEQVEVRGWDYKQKRSIVSQCGQPRILTETEYGAGKQQSSAFQGQPRSPKMVVVDQPMATPKEADRMAQALFDELSDEYVQADGRTQGDPRLRPGRVVRLQDMHKYSGDYYLTETRHVFSEGIYTTHFAVRGLRGGNILSLLSPPQRLQPGQTLLIGKVTNNQDPEGLGRVRVQLPTLTEEHESAWARVVAIGAGKARGFDCLPEIDDEVLVGFEHGDIHRPFVMGGLWNGKDETPVPVGESVTDQRVRVRTFRTRTGHVLQFVEEERGSSKAGIDLVSRAGHRIQINDTDEKVEVRTAGGHVLCLDDRARKIELSSVGSVAVKAATTLDLEAGGVVTVKGAMIKLN